MPKQYTFCFSDIATESILSLSKRRQRLVMRSAYALARYPGIESDYTLLDAEGRKIEHLLTEGVVFSYWVDDSSCTLMIIEVDDAE